MKSSSAAQHAFSMIPSVKMPRSTFDRSHGYKTTFNAGWLVPCMVDEVLPGDTINLKASILARLATPIFPVMDNIFLDYFFFFVPNRLLWNNWEKFNGAQTNPGDSTSFLVPQIQSPNILGGFVEQDLFDYFGLPTKKTNIFANALHSRAYNLIYNEWFRDQNLQNSVHFDTDDGPDSYANYQLLQRGKRHDYFTSCLPFPQKGPAVSLPLGTTAPLLNVGGDPTVGISFIGATSAFNYQPLTVAAVPLAALLTDSAGASAETVNVTPTLAASQITTKFLVDLSSATAATINAFRQANKIQELYERDARGGTRYIEIVKSHFDVNSPDARLQRPEYLGGGSVPVNFHPVPQMSVSAATPQGNLAAFATASAQFPGFSKSFTEHGVVIGMVSVRADMNYQNGLDRMFSRRTRFDYYWPTLANLGEQAVLSQEIYADGTGSDSNVFGYQERYAEYRFKPSRVTGQFRSNAATPLDAWHLAQNFSSRPVLGSSFIVENPPIARIVAVPSEPNFILDAYFSMKHSRPLPVYGIPSLTSHF